jgi:hypothetical protein
VTRSAVAAQFRRISRPSRTANHTALRYDGRYARRGGTRPVSSSPCTGCGLFRDAARNAVVVQCRSDWAGHLRGYGTSAHTRQRTEEEEEADATARAGCPGPHRGHLRAIRGRERRAAAGVNRLATLALTRIFCVPPVAHTCTTARDVVCSDSRLNPGPVSTLAQMCRDPISGARGAARHDAFGVHARRTDSPASGCYRR